MSRRLKRALGICTVSLALTAGLAPAPVHAAPDAVAKAQKELDRLENEASAADTRYTELVDQLAKANKALKTATADLAKQEKKVKAMSGQLGQLALADYQSRGVNMTAQLLASNDDADFLGKLATVESVQGRTNQRMQDYQLAQASLTTVKKQLAEARATIAQATTEQKAVAAKYERLEAEQRKVVAKLTAQEQARLAELERQRVAAQTAAVMNQLGTQNASATSRSQARAAIGGEQAPLTAGSSSRARIAIAFAMSKVGGPYVWGGTGPVGYDCSGLMMMAWAAAGVSIPRVTTTQFAAGVPVPLGSLQPGDLVFYRGAAPQHVAMYIGGGRVVHEASRRSGIKVSPVGMMPPVGARRVG